MVTTTSIPVHCPACGRPSREAAEKLREGATLTCPHCEARFELSEASGQLDILHMLSTAKDVRRAKRYRLWALQHGYLA